jgi:hypothetical protein
MRVRTQQLGFCSSALLLACAGRHATMSGAACSRTVNTLCWCLTSQTHQRC